MPVTAVSDSAAFRGLLTLVAHTGFSYKTRCDPGKGASQVRPVGPFI